MIETTFVHCPGIGPVGEKKIHDAGFKDWSSALGNINKLPISRKVKANLAEKIRQSISALEREDIPFFVKHFPVKDQWKVLGRFYERASYFDIETTEAVLGRAEITVIACLHKGELHHFVRDENLDDFLDLLDDVELMLSFNGSSFDIPHVLDHFHIPEIPCAHIDLRWQCYHCGYRYGLKSIETEIGIERPIDLRGVDGFEAIYLWHDWLNGSSEARNKLIRYCGADVLSLKFVAAHILNHCGIPVDSPSSENLWNYLK